jgi:hypothetical protein
VQGPAQSLVSCNERPQALVDLAIDALAALLDREHHQQADAHADESEQGQAYQG